MPTVRAWGLQGRCLACPRSGAPGLPIPATSGTGHHHLQGPLEFFLRLSSEVLVNLDMDVRWSLWVGVSHSFPVLPRWFLALSNRRAPGT